MEKGQSAKTLQKKSYSYFDIIKMESKSIYSSIGEMVVSQKPSAPKFSFGTSDRNGRKKIYDNEKIAKVDLVGQYGNGSASYFPSTELVVKQNKKTIELKENPTEKFKFEEAPKHKIGTSDRPNYSKQKYDYYKSRDDYIKPDDADKVRRHSQSCVRIGLDQRWKDQRKDKITPGPQYNPNLKQEIPIPEKYTFGFRRPLKDDPLVAQVSTNPIVGPGAYFPPAKSESAKILRIPTDSRIESRPLYGFPKGPKTLATHKKAIQQTYDIKTNTIMAHYDFQYDGGKGLNTGTAWLKQKIEQSRRNPLQKNKMKSYTIGKSTREEKRGVFKDTMQYRPAPVRIPHPKI